MIIGLKSLIKQIGLDPANYGTHSLRSGGTTELFLIHKEAVWIQHFGWWNNIGSVNIYIRPNNPDLKKVFGSTIEYIELRDKESRILEEIEHSYSEYKLELKKQVNKQKRQKRHQQRMKHIAINCGSNSYQIVPHSNEPNYSYNKTSNQHVYNQYNEDTYHCTNNQWSFNNKAKARLVISNKSDVRTLVPIPPVALPTPRKNPYKHW